jgi:hypothetical protein
MPTIESWTILQGTFVRHHVVSCCTSGFQTAAPSGHGEAVCAHARLWPAHVDARSGLGHWPVEPHV